MQIKKKIITGIALTAVLFTQTNFVSAASQIEDKDSVFMTVNGQNVKEQELYDTITLNASYGPALEVVDLKVLKEKYKDDSRLEAMINEKFDKAKTEVKDEDPQMKAAFASFGAVDKDDYIDKSGILLDSYRELARIDTSYNEIFTKAEKDYIYNNRFSSTADIFHILISPKIAVENNGNEEVTKKAKAEALAKAEKVIKEINSGLSFQDAVKKYSDDQSTVDGKLGNFDVTSARKAKVDQAIINEAFSLKNKEVSAKPVLGTFGYEIVMVNITKEKESYDNLKNDIAKKLYDIYFENNKNIAEYSMDLFRSDNKLAFMDNVLSKAYANSKLNTRKTYTQFDPNAQQDPYGQGY